MTHSGQGDEPQHPAARPAHEGVVLPGDGSAPWVPGRSAEPPAQGPAGGQPWGQPWGPQDGSQEQSGYGEAGHGGPQSYGPQPGAQPYGQQDGVPYGGGLPQPLPQGQPLPQAQGQPLPQAQGHGQGYQEQGGYQGHDLQGLPGLPGQGQLPGQVQGHGMGLPFPQQEQQPYQPQGQSPRHAQPQPLPAEAPAQGGADATRYLPPVPAVPGMPVTGDSDATQFIAPVPAGPGHGPGGGPGTLPPENAAEATQFLPSPIPGAGPDADATQYIAPVPAQQGPAHAGPGQARSVPAAPPGAPFGVRPGEPGERQPPAEFDSLFRTDAPGGGQGADSTQPLPQFDAGRGPQPSAHRAPAAPHAPQQRTSYDPPGRAAAREAQGRSAGRRKSSPLPLIAAVVVGCAVLGLGAGALMSGGGDSPAQDDSKTVAAASSPPAEESPGQSAPDPAKTQAEALDKLLADSGDSRATVIAAVESIKSCDNLDQAATDLHGAAEQRRDLVTRLKDLTLDKLPDNGELTSSLTDAWQASASADDHYANWARQSKGRKNCRGGQARSTEQAAEANRASGEATAAKQKAAELWNGIAAKYNLTERAPTQL
ncbi:hypothetical protein [Streptomyces lushanensis]|uniref:hypothetical protein n=1 Tax=Streptomyces lushanensis TaxID=1434255 RepID=UPI00082A8DC2|nr:hypothetical protein [Streptomyces lushanensis]